MNLPTKPLAWQVLRVGRRTCALLLGAALATATADETAPTTATGGAFTHTEYSADAFLQPGPLADEKQRKTYRDGLEALEQRWVPPFLSGGPWGRGPLSNAETCADCHAHNGRGRAPNTADEPLRSVLVRLSVPGNDARGGPKPHPAYGDQFNHLGVDTRVAGEGEVYVTWQAKEAKFADAEIIALRAPKLEFKQLRYGPLGAETLLSVRIAPQLVGLGLLEAIPEGTILALAQQQDKPHGVKGKPNMVWDFAAKRIVLGRFGLKANQPSLSQQIMAAFHADIGITSELFPEETCSPTQRDCAAMIPAGRPELLSNQFTPLLFFLRANAVPARRNQADADVRRGERLFATAGCSACHIPELKTGDYPGLNALSNQNIRPYTDLLLHDMGEDLADGRPDYLASGREWRTAPLWSIGLLTQVTGATDLLHDGRARNTAEAIVWHGGEASYSREAFLHMSKEERAALLKFLESL
jgi:CxxC motif-containing protein (DUF1111 family)